MTPTAVIVAALSIMSGSPDQMELDGALGSQKDEIIQQVQNLEGSRLTQVRETIDILAGYNLDIRTGDMIFARNSEAEGVSYSTDPPEDTILPV